MHHTFIMAFGSNMGNSLSIIEGALARLKEDSRLSFEKVSSLYRTKAWGKTDQSDFINGAALISWTGSPEELMTLFLTVEKEFGRQREIHWGPRTLDLDLIYSEGITRDTDFLHLPHPWFWERPFVLVPLEELLPGFIYKGENIHQRIMELHGYGDVEKIESGKENGNHGK